MKQLPLVPALAVLSLLTACGSAPSEPPTHHRSPVASTVAGAPVTSGPTGAGARGATPTGALGSPTTPAAPATRSTAAPTPARGAASSAAPAPGGTAGAPARTTPAPRGAGTTRDDGSRTLSIPALGVKAPVTGCATQDGTVTPPSDIGAVCLWTGGKDFGAVAGTTIVVGHSTRSKKSVGALEYVRELQVGDTVSVAGQSWRVAEVLPGVDKRSLPGWITAEDGPRQLGLITCETTSRTRNDIARLVPAG